MQSSWINPGLSYLPFSLPLLALVSFLTPRQVLSPSGTLSFISWGLSSFVLGSLHALLYLWCLGDLPRTSNRPSSNDPQISVPAHSPFLRARSLYATGWWTSSLSSLLQAVLIPYVHNSISYLLPKPAFLSLLSTFPFLFCHVQRPSLLPLVSGLCLCSRGTQSLPCI